VIFKNRLLLVVLFLFAVSLGQAQDIVVLNNGRKIYCRIVNIDSVSISYTLPHQKRQFEIQKTEVYRYDQRSASKTKNIYPHRPRDFSEKLVIGFSGGPATPLDEFASQDVNSIKSGLAKTGFFFQANSVLKLNQYFGFTFDYHYQAHAFSDGLIASQLNNIYRGNPFFTTTSTKWKIRGFFGGIHICLPVKSIDHLSFDINLAAGVPKVTLPELNIVAKGTGGAVTVTQYLSVTTAPTFLGGLGLKYRVQENVAFTVYVNYLQTKAQFTNVYTLATNGVYSYDNYTQKISTLNVQFGLSFMIFAENKVRPSDMR